MDPDEYSTNAVISCPDESGLIGYSNIMVKYSIILFSSSLTINFATLFFLYTIQKEYYYSCIVFLIIAIQSFNAINSCL